jgi:hypothetical protein
MSSLIFSNSAKSLRSLNKNLSVAKKFKIEEITSQEIISEIINITTKILEAKLTNSIQRDTKVDFEKIKSLLSISRKLNYSEFDELSSILFELSKDESKIQFVFENCKYLISKYDFLNGLSNLPFYYFEKSKNISKDSFGELYLEYLKKVPMEFYGKWDLYWKPSCLIPTQQIELIRIKYDEINSTPFDFQNKAIFEFSYKLLPIWALNDELRAFYPFLKQITNLPLESKTKQNQWLYTINPNSKYATYHNSATRALNYYTYKNPQLNKYDLDLVTDLLKDIDTYHHPVETKFYASILFNIYPEKTYKGFNHIFKNVKDPSIAEKYWRDKDYNYDNLCKWFSNNGFITDIEIEKKKIENLTIENANFILNNKFNIINILKITENIINYDAEYGSIPIRYDYVFQENYLEQIEKEIGRIELVQIPNNQKSVYLVFENKYYIFNVNDCGDYIDTSSLSNLCNYLLAIKGSKKRVIPIATEDQSSMNLFLDLDAANRIIKKYEIEVLNT